MGNFPHDYVAHHDDQADDNALDSLDHAVTLEILKDCLSRSPWFRHDDQADNNALDSLDHAVTEESLKDSHPSSSSRLRHDDQADNNALDS